MRTGGENQPSHSGQYRKKHPVAANQTHGELEAETFWLGKWDSKTEHATPRGRETRCEQEVAGGNNTKHVYSPATGVIPSDAFSDCPVLFQSRFLHGLESKG